MTTTTIPTLDLADQAAQAVRELNHRTRGAGAFTGPAELYRLVAELALLVGRLPQLLGQLDQWLHTEHDAGRLRTDNRTDPGPAVRDAAAHLADASDAAHDLAHVLASAQQRLAHLSATKPTTPPTKGVSFQPLKGGQFSSAVDNENAPNMWTPPGPARATNPRCKKQVADTPAHLRSGSVVNRQYVPMAQYGAPRGKPQRGNYPSYVVGSGVNYRPGVNLPPAEADKLVTAALAMDCSVSGLLQQLVARMPVDAQGAPTWYEAPAQQSLIA